VAGNKSFLFYLDWRQHLAMLTDEERGQLLMKLLDYSETGVLPDDMGGAVGMAFSFMRAQLDRDKEKYEARCKANRENGAKGGRPPKE
jgi:hypothetical protein